AHESRGRATSTGAPGRRPPQRTPFVGRDEEMKVYGTRAVEAVFELRREDIIRVYVTQARAAEFGELLSWCAAERRAYHLVLREELDRIADAVHHEGICLLVKKPRKRTVE